MLKFTNGPKLTPCKFLIAPGRDIRSHTKTMLVSGGLLGGSYPVVYTGSQSACSSHPVS